MTHGVYAIKNLNTGKVYVGAAVNLERRRSLHWHHLRRGTHHSPKLQSDWDRHGKEAFIFEIIEFSSDRDKLVEREQRWLDFLGGFSDGYNMTPFSDSCRGIVRSPETKSKLSAAKKGVRHPPESRTRLPKSADHRAKISAAKKGKSGLHSEEGKRNIGIATARRNKSLEMREKVRASKLALYASPERLAELKANGRKGALAAARVNSGRKRLPFSAETRAAMSAAAKGRMAKTPRGPDGRLYPSRCGAS